MEPTKPTSLPSTNPPSVEVAYKRKCIALKKRLSDIEDENELMRVRNKRGWQYIHKMRLESCILLERLAESTGMANEQDDLMLDPELEYDRRMARATARMKYGHLPAPGNGGPPYFADETEGSSDEQPSTTIQPQPQERPLRIKRSRKSPTEKDNEGYDEQGSVAGQPPASGDSQAAARRPTQDEMTSSFRIQTGSNGNGNEDGATSAADKDESTSRLPSTGPAQEPTRNGTGPGITEDQQQQQQQPVPEPEPATADNTTTPMDMDTKEEPKEG